MKISHRIQSHISGVYSHTPNIGLRTTADQNNRGDGISALVTIRNEPWIEPSLLSIKDLVDEFVIVDSSTYDISSTIKKLKKAGLNIKYSKAKGNYPKQVQTALNQSTKKWILRWDGDLIAYTSGKGDIKKLKDLISGLDPKKYYAISFGLFNLDFDLFHTERLNHREAYLFTFSPHLLKKKSFLKSTAIKAYCKLKSTLPPRIHFMPLPLWYKKINLDSTVALHLRTVKSKERILECPCQPLWGLESDEFRAKFSNSYEKFVQHMQETGLGEKFIARIQKGLQPFDHKKYGYPQTLTGWLSENLNLKIENTNEFNTTIRKFLETTFKDK
jgi:hypothetical protein